MSIWFGGSHLAELVEKTGSYYSALAAYNAGEKPIKRWLQVPGTRDDPLLFTEIVDYAQTRHYIRIVMENYFRYRQLWESA